MREAVEEEDFSSSVFHRLPLQKDVDSFSKRHRHHPTCPMFSTCWRGDSTVAAPASLSPVFCLQKQGKREQKKRRRREERKHKRGGRPKEIKKEEAKKRMKNREEREEKQTEPLLNKHLILTIT
jgi:hypothetical protein